MWKGRPKTGIHQATSQTHSLFFTITLTFQLPFPSWLRGRFISRGLTPIGWCSAVELTSPALTEATKTLPPALFDLKN